MISYEGIFFEGDALDTIHRLEHSMLDVVNDEIHCTFKYHPTKEELFDDIIGQEFEVVLVGYANDGVNSGFQILLPPELLKYYINYEEENPKKLKIPHITASLSTLGKASNTRKLNFQRMKNPVNVVGKFGYWIKEEDREYLSYDLSTNRKVR